MNILLIGGTNFIGPSVIRHLINMGHDVTVFHRGKTKAEFPDAVNHIFGDRSNLKSFKSEFEKLSPTVVVDMIAYTEEDATTTMNTFKGIAQRVVTISSIDVYRAYGVILGRESDVVSVPLTEDSPLRSSYYPFRDMPQRPLNAPTDYEKIFVEKVVMSEPELPGTIIRLPMVYGYKDPLNRFQPYLQRMDDKRPAIILEESIAKWRGSYGYVENIGFAIALAATNEKAKGRIYHVAEEKTLSESDRITKIAELVGWEGNLIFLSQKELPADWKLMLNTQQEWFVDSTRIRQELGYQEIVPLNEALYETVKYLRQHSPIPSQNNSAPWLLEYKTEDEICMALS
ncbi:MAG: NAD-dependent epimerase/dehydratase family protein [Cyanobacteria bacterium P01_A01_bin.84]